MYIHHVALWTSQLETLRDFYVQHFNATATPIYENAAKRFRSCFLSFAGGARLELMTRPGLAPTPPTHARGVAHFAFSVGSEIEVTQFTGRLSAQGIRILGAPRRTGDGYFESIVADPDGNPVEITV